MKYDDAELCFLNFETELANEAGGTLIGMYLAWAAQRGLLGATFAGADAQRQVARLLAREITGRDLYFDCCDGKLTGDDFSAQGNAFTAWYYERQFVLDFERVFREQIPDTGHATDDFCSVPDTWANCDRLARALDHRFSQWNAGRNAPRRDGHARNDWLFFAISARTDLKASRTLFWNGRIIARIGVDGMRPRRVATGLVLREPMRFRVRVVGLPPPGAPPQEPAPGVRTPPGAESADGWPPTGERDA